MLARQTLLGLLSSVLHLSYHMNVITDKSKGGSDKGGKEPEKILSGIIERYSSHWEDSIVITVSEPGYHPKPPVYTLLYEVYDFST